MSFFYNFVNSLLTKSVNRLLTLLTNSEGVPCNSFIQEVNKNGDILLGIII
jgi:hypothetical protein